jgi:hypothetical protein
MARRWKPEDDQSGMEALGVLIVLFTVALPLWIIWL